MAFIFVGQVNVLAPIVTINFMLTYSIIDYSYFCVAMSFDLQAKEIKSLPKQLSIQGARRPLLGASPSGYGTALPNHSNGTLLEFTKDMDQIFQPQKSEVEKMCTTGRRPSTPGRQALMESFGLELGRNMPSAMGDLGPSGMYHSQELGEQDKFEESLQKEATGTQESQLGIQEPHDDRQAETCPSGTADIDCNPKSLLDSTGILHTY